MFGYGRVIDRRSISETGDTSSFPDDSRGDPGGGETVAGSLSLSRTCGRPENGPRSFLSVQLAYMTQGRIRCMVNTTVHTLSAIFAIISGTGAGFLALVFWQVLRESPFGTVVALLSGTMSAMIVYHVVLFVVEPDTLLVEILRSGLYTIVAIFLWLVIATHQQIEQSAGGGDAR